MIHSAGKLTLTRVCFPVGYPLVAAVSALGKARRHGRKEVAVRGSVVVLYALNSLSKKAGSKYFVVLTSGGANATAPVVVNAHSCMVLVVVLY